MVHLIGREPSDRPSVAMVESRQGEVLAIIGVFTALAFIFVGGRLYSRYLGRNFGWDDHLIVAASVFLFGQTLATWKWVLLSGTGFHIWDVPKRSLEEKLTANRWNFAIQMLYHPLMGATRASIILFLFRMKDNKRRIRYSLHVVFWLNILYAVGTSLGNILQCRPVRYAWEKPALDTLDANGKVIPGGVCIDSREFILTSCALSIFMDLVIIPIPSIMVWNLQMPFKTKILVVSVMSLGWVATGVSVGRFVVYYYRFAPSNTDRTWNIGIAISIAEPAVHIMTACAPATKCLLRNLFPYFDSTTEYYEDRTGTKQSARMGNYASASHNRTLGSFSLSNNNRNRDDDDMIIEEHMLSRPDRAETKGQNDYRMERINSVESRRTIPGSSDDTSTGKESTELTRPRGPSCSRTDRSELIEAEPIHCLAPTK